MERDFIQNAETMAKELKLPEKFLSQLKTEDDWTFIIKTHFLLEGAVSHLLAVALRNDSLHAIFSKMGISKKIEFLEALKLFDNQFRGFIKALSELRNQLAHRLTNADFSFAKHLSDKNNLARFIHSFGFVWKDPIIFDNQKAERNIFIKENPRITIWLGLMLILDYMKVEKDSVELKIQEEQFTKDSGARLSVILEKYKLEVNP